MTIADMRQEVADVLTDKGFLASTYIPEQVYPEQAIALVGFGDPYLQPADNQVYGAVRLDVRLKVTIISPIAGSNEEATAALDEVIVSALEALAGTDWGVESFEGPGPFETTAFPAVNINIKNVLEVTR